MRFRGVSLDSLGANVQLHGTEATLENLEVRHGDDFVQAHGTANLISPHAYSARLTGAISDLSAYAPLLPKNWHSAPIAGGVTFDWSGDGNLAASSGTMQLYAHGLRLPLAPFRSPFDLTLEGTYSPQDIFLRNFKLANNRSSLGAFVMLGSNFIELQALALNLDGKTRATGTLFLPISVDRWRKTGDLLAALDEGQKFDVDLAVDGLDIPIFAKALGEKLPFTGQLNGKLAAYGALASLQLTTDWHLKNLGPSSAGNALDFDLHYDHRRADANLRATFGVSAPLVVQASLPLRLNRRSLRAKSIVDRTQPFSVEADCPALFLETLPEKWQLLGAKRGLLSGRIAFSGIWRAPKIEGAAQLLEAQFVPTPPIPVLTNLAATFHFKNHVALIPDLRLDANGTRFQGHGSFTTNPPYFTLALTAEDFLDPADGGATFGALGEGSNDAAPRRRTAVVRGKAGSSAFSLTIVTGFRQKTFFYGSPGNDNSGLQLLNVAAP